MSIKYHSFIKLTGLHFRVLQITVIPLIKENPITDDNIIKHTFINVINHSEILANKELKNINEIIKFKNDVHINIIKSNKTLSLKNIW